MVADQQYQQAGLVVYGDDNNYAKMVLQGRNATADHAARSSSSSGRRTACRTR